MKIGAYDRKNLHLASFITVINGFLKVHEMFLKEKLHTILIKWVSKLDIKKK